MKYNETDAATVNCMGVVVCGRCDNGLTVEDLELDGIYYEVGDYICPYCSNPFSLNQRQVYLSSRKIDILHNDGRLQ
jgi:uncharacterized CHY-type Zn-finger protein